MLQMKSGMGQWVHRVDMLTLEVISSPVEADSNGHAPRGGDPTRRDRRHHRF